MVAGFLGDWFVRKTLWSSPTAVKESAASFKKFYGYLLDVKGMISKEDYNEMCLEIKENLAEWADNAKLDDDWGW